MNNKILKNSIIGVLTIIILLILGVLAIRPFDIHIVDNALVDANTDDIKVVNGHTNHITDFENHTDRVVGFVDNVFVGKVTKDLGTIRDSDDPLYEIPHTEFNVDVLYNIKGYLSGNIGITQMGGYGDFGVLHIYNNKELFKEGGVYVFSTKGDIHQVISSSNSSHLLFDATNLDNDEIKELIKNDEKVAEFRDAYINEDPTLGVEGADFSGPTSYKNLSKSEKEAFENFDNGFVD